MKAGKDGYNTVGVRADVTTANQIRTKLRLVQATMICESGGADIPQNEVLLRLMTDFLKARERA